MSTEAARGPAVVAGRSAFLVAAGILLSRLAGLVRQRVFAHYFGLQTDAADAFNAAFRIPNFLQNLFGEGALSASFIPVYAALVARGERREADRVAGAVASLLALVVARARARRRPRHAAAHRRRSRPGFTGAKRELTIEIVRILFPGAGLLVLSAWCLGVLNSHHRFLLSYAAPVMWNAAMIATLVVVRRRGRRCRGSPCCWRGDRSSAARCSSPCSCRSCCASRRICGSRSTLTSEHVRTVVAQLRAGVHQPRRRAGERLHRRAAREPAADRRRHRPGERAAALHAAGQPVRHVGVGGGAAGDVGRGRRSTRPAPRRVRRRLDAGLRQIAFFVVPSAMAFLALGDVIAAALLQTGRFRHADAVYVWGILAGSAVGLLASTLGRLYSSTYYALRDTRTPLRYAVVRVVLTTVLGYLFAIPLPRWLGIASRVGRGGADGVGRHRRVGGDAAAAAHAQRADRPNRAAVGTDGEAVGGGASAAPRRGR